MGREVVPLDKLRVEREPGFGPPDDLTALEQSMATQGIKKYILVNNEYVVIDGARQLEVLKKWGRTETQVVKSTDLNFTAQVLKRRHEDPFPDGVKKALTPRRIWEIFNNLETQRREHSNTQRSVGAKNGHRGVPTKPIPSARLIIAQALGHTTEANLASASRLFRLWASAEGEEKAFVESVIRQMDEDPTFTVHMAKGKVDRWQTNRMQLARAGSKKDQEELLNRAVEMLTGVNAALAPLVQVADGHDLSDLARWDDTVSKTRSLMYNLSRVLRQRMNQE